MRDYFARNPAIEAVWRVKETLSWILLRKHRTKRQCARLVPRFLRILEQLRACPFAPLATLGDTLHNWAEQIVPMWRFTRNNGITEGFHTRIEVLQRQAYGFRNFANYRMRVRAMCSRAVPRF